MGDILQMTFWNEFSWMNVSEYQIEVNLNMFLKI